MRFQLTIVSLFLSLNSFASDDGAMKELFLKYDLIMDSKKIELIDEVFTERFIKGSGGKAELIEKIKDLAVPKEKSLQPKSQITWKKGQKEDFFFATMKEVSQNKGKSTSHEAEFIVLKENGKLKIDGTLSDGN